MSNTQTNANAIVVHETKALVLKSRSAFANINAITQEARSVIQTAENEAERSYATACAIQQLKSALTPEILKPIMSLQGTRLGFKTDKIYDEDTIKQVCVETWLFGLRTHGNEINILAGQMYAAQAGLERLVNEAIDAGTFVEHTPSLPTVKDGKWACEYTAKYTFGGTSRTVSRMFSGRHFGNATSDDQVIGKCRRKILLEIHRQITGLSLGDADVDEAKREMKNVTPTGLEALASAELENTAHA